MKAIWAVGESFRHFAEHDEVYTASDMLAALSSEVAFGEPVALRVGLGINGEAWDKICAAARGNDTVRVEQGPPSPVDRALVNKRYEDNVFIGDPLRIDEDRFGADLLIADDSEMVRDQPADRQHVPGFALAEAAAQLVRWAVKVRFPAPPGRPARYVVMHAMRCRFERFTFPIAARLLATFNVTDGPNADRIPVNAVINIEQGGRMVSSCEFDFHAFYPDHIFAVEQAQASKLLTGKGDKR